MDKKQELLKEEMIKDGWKEVTFEELPCIKVDNIEEYARSNGFLTQEEYNNRIKNAMK